MVEFFRYSEAMRIDWPEGRAQLAELRSIPGFYNAGNRNIPEFFSELSAGDFERGTKLLFPNLSKASLNIINLPPTWSSYDEVSFQRKWKNRNPYPILHGGCFLSNIEELVIDKYTARGRGLPSIIYPLVYFFDMSNLSRTTIVCESVDGARNRLFRMMGPGKQERNDILLVERRPKLGREYQY